MDVQAIVFWSRMGAGLLGGVGVLFLIWGLARWRPGRQKKFCPSARARGVWRINPLRLILPRVCGYDLTGVPIDSQGRVTCPECGRELRLQRAALRSAPRWWPGRMAVAFAVLAGVVACSPMLKTHRWQRLVPTTVLIGVKRAVGTEWMPTRLRRELDGRIKRKELWGWQARWVIPALQKDLREDNADRNAFRALEFLREMGSAGKRALEHSLLSPDYQERQLAATELRNMCLRWTEHGRERTSTPSDALLRVTVEGLQDDSKLWKSCATYNAYVGVHFLSYFPEVTAPYLKVGLASTDEQQRMLCASLAARGRHRELYDRAVPILVSHLADNATFGDGRFVAPALVAMGQDALPSLMQLTSMGDPQQRAAARAILAHLEPAATNRASVDLYRALSSGRWEGEAPFGYNLIYYGD
jgi:hypothetical protein